jgi:hypothetical protein
MVSLSAELTFISQIAQLGGALEAGVSTNR